MLVKLLKYDMRSIGRIIWPILGALLLLSVVIGIYNPERFFSTGPMAGNADGLSAFLIILFSSTLVASMSMVVYMIVQRFNRNLLGKEGYLMFSLPVSTLTHVFEKILLALLWSFIWLIGIGICFGIIVLFQLKGISLQELMQALSQSRLTIHGVAGFLQELLTIVFLITTLTSLVYASIAVGHLVSSHRFIVSAFTFAALVVILSRLDRLMNLYVLIGSSAWGAIVILMLYTIINGLLAWLILDRRLNLD